jgi:hypothetical protein
MNIKKLRGNKQEVSYRKVRTNFWSSSHFYWFHKEDHLNDGLRLGYNICDLFNIEK